MPRPPPFLVVLALAAGCSFEVDYGDTTFQCVDPGDCPDGFTCVAEECRPGGGDGDPTAAFTSDASFLLVSFDATSSTDPDGDLDDFAWSFGDDSTGTGVTISHTYEAAGAYQVTLTVTDDAGHTDTVSNQVTVVAPAEPIAKDDFGRAVDPGWGSAEVGGPWSLGGGIDVWRVSGGLGHVVVATGSGPNAVLEETEADSTDFTASFASQEVSTGSGLYFSFIGRRVSVGNTYEVSVNLEPDQEVRVDVGKRVGNDEMELQSMLVPGVTYDAGTVLRVRAQVFGIDPTTVRARVWLADADEPGDWQVTATDSEAVLQAPGMVALNAYLSSSATNGPIEAVYDDLLVVPVE